MYIFPYYALYVLSTFVYSYVNSSIRSEQSLTILSNGLSTYLDSKSSIVVLSLT